jgi:dimeric dUTPase (all-alpha-NTP-PPase superfamily)
LAFGKGLVAPQFKTKVQLKGLTHMFCFSILSDKLYEQHVFPLLITYNAYANLGQVKKYLTLNENCKVNEILFGYSFYLHFPFPTYLPTYTSK